MQQKEKVVQNQNGQLSDKSIVELKAMVYDLVAAIERNQQVIQVINKEIIERTDTTNKVES